MKEETDMKTWEFFSRGHYFIRHITRDKILAVLLVIASFLVGCADKEKQQLHGQVAFLQSQVVSLTSQLEEVQNQLQDVQLEVDTLKSEIDDLNSHIDSFSYDDWRDVVQNVQYSILNVESAANNIEFAVQQAVDAAN